MAQQFDDWYKVTKDNIPKFNIKMLRQIEKELLELPVNPKISELLELTRREELKKVIINISSYDISFLQEMIKDLLERKKNIGKPLQGLYSMDMILNLKSNIDKNIDQLQKAADKNAFLVGTLPSVPKKPEPVVTVDPLTWGDLETNTSYSGDPYAPMARFRARKANKSVRKVKKSARKSTRKVKKSARKSTRKVKKSVRKSIRKAKKSLRKSTRKVKKSVRKSTRKTKKSVRKSSRKVKKSVRKLKARH